MSKGSRQRTYGEQYAENYDSIDWQYKNARQLDKWVNDIKRMDAPKPVPRDILLSFKVCCGNGCTNCPYKPKHTNGSRDLA